jgi:Aldo/keto reductase family
MIWKPCGRSRASSAGKIRYWGLSNFTGWQLTKAVHLARALNVAGPVTLQPHYSLLVREIEWEIVPAVIDEGLGLLPWSPLGGGWLSGKYQRDQRPTGATRHRRAHEHDTGTTAGQPVSPAHGRRNADRAHQRPRASAGRRASRARTHPPADAPAAPPPQITGSRASAAGCMIITTARPGPRPLPTPPSLIAGCLPACCPTATSASVGAALRPGAQNPPSLDAAAALGLAGHPVRVVRGRPARSPHPAAGSPQASASARPRPCCRSAGRCYGRRGSPTIPRPGHQPRDGHLSQGHAGPVGHLAHRLATAGDQGCQVCASGLGCRPGINAARGRRGRGGRR